MPAVTQWPATMSTDAKSIWAMDTASLPPLTQAVRQSWGVHTPWPVPSADAMAALFAAVYHLEQRVIALES